MHTRLLGSVYNNILYEEAAHSIFAIYFLSFKSQNRHSTKLFLQASDMGPHNPYPQLGECVPSPFGSGGGGDTLACGTGGGGSLF